MLSPKCGATLHGVQRAKFAIVSEWSLATVKRAIANRRTRKSSLTSFKRCGQWGQTIAQVARNQMYGRKAGIHFGIRPSVSEMISLNTNRTLVVSGVPIGYMAGGKLGNSLDQYLLEQPHVVEFITLLLRDGSK